MSGFLVRINKIKNEKKLKLSEADYSYFKNEKFEIIYQKDTICEFRKDLSFAVSGIGLSTEKIFDKEDWKEKIKNNIGCNFNFDGHFAGFVFRNEGFVFFNDQTAARDLYFYENDEALYVSTQFSVLIDYAENLALNKDYICAWWSFSNLLTEECIFKNIGTFGTCGKAFYKNGKFSLKKTPWLPEKTDDYDDKSIYELIYDYTVLPIKSGFRLNLGLSGGADSRTLFAYLYQSGYKNWHTHSFGDYLDSKIARKIAKFYNAEWKNYNIDGEEFTNVENFEKFVYETNALMPVYLHSELSSYRQIPKDDFFIDGGRGEYLRRSLGIRFGLTLKKLFKNNDIEGIRKQFLYRKPDIFSKDITCDWEKLTKKQTCKVLEDMPPFFEFGSDNWIDLLNIRYRRGDVTQARLDKYIRNYMPFRQKSVLKKAFEISPKIRNSEKINKKIISGTPGLMLFPFARYDTIIPYQHNKYTAYAWAKLLRIFFSEANKKQDKFLHKNKEYILDILNGSRLQNSSVYNKIKIRESARRYFKGDKNQTNLLIWFITSYPFLKRF